MRDSSGKSSLIGRPCESCAITSLDKWSATTFSTPFLSLIWRLNSWSKRIHHINLALASCLVSKYFKAEWSVNTTIEDPTKRSTKLIQGKNYSQQLLLSSCVVLLSLIQSSACIIDHIGVDPAFSMARMRFPLEWRNSIFIILFEKLIFIDYLKMTWSRHLFLFYF